MANIKSIGGNPIVLDASGIAAGAVTPDKLADMGGITAGAALGITSDGPTESAAWLQRVSTSDGPTTIRSIHGNTIVQDGELVSVQMEGIESTGFNQWDEQWEQGRFDTTTGVNVPTGDTQIRAKNLVPVFPRTEYHIETPTPVWCIFFDADRNVLTTDLPNAQAAGNSRLIGGKTTHPENFTTPANCHYMRFYTQNVYGNTYKGDICINLSGPRNGEYEPYWHQTRSIPAGTLRNAGTVYDEQTATERIVRVGVVDLGALEWIKESTSYEYRARRADNPSIPMWAGSSAGNIKSDCICSKFTTLTPNDTYRAANVGISLSGDSYISVGADSTYADAAAFKAAMSGVMLHYALATPTTTPIDPPLNMSYRTAAGGTERVMVPTGELSAPPTLVTAQGYTAESLRDAALSCIAPVENGKASTNYGIGSYLVHGGQLCKVTTAIATGEAITIGTNVVTTTVMAEVIALTQ